LTGQVLQTSMASRRVSETNIQVIGRTDPSLIDLIAALATGSVGAFALVRADVSDTLPGVAIAISLVPPSCSCSIGCETLRRRPAGSSEGCGAAP
jgi:uncharacterized membrane protein